MYHLMKFWCAEWNICNRMWMWVRVCMCYAWHRYVCIHSYCFPEPFICHGQRKPEQGFFLFALPVHCGAVPSQQHRDQCAMIDGSIIQSVDASRQCLAQFPMIGPIFIGKISRSADVMDASIMALTITCFDVLTYNNIPLKLIPICALFVLTGRRSLIYGCLWCQVVIR